MHVSTASVRQLLGRPEPARPRAFGGRLVLGIEQGAASEGEAPATDAAVQGGLQGLQSLDPSFHERSPADAHLAPLTLRWRPVSRQLAEGVADLGQGEPDDLPSGDHGQPTERVAWEATVVDAGALRPDQSPSLVVVDRGDADASPSCQLSHGEKICGLHAGHDTQPASRCP